MPSNAKKGIADEGGLEAPRREPGRSSLSAHGAQPRRANRNAATAVNSRRRPHEQAQAKSSRSPLHRKPL